MKILHAIHSADLAGGGPIEGIRQLAAATDHRFAHSIVSLDAPDAPFLSDVALPVHALGPAGPLGYSPRLVPWLREHAGEYRAVVVHGLWRYISVGCWRALHDLDVPYFAFPHGMLDPWFKQRYPLKHLKKLFFWPWTEYRMLRDARAVIFTCEDEKLRSRQSFSPYRANEEIAVLGIHRPPAHAEEQRAAFYARFPHLRDRRLLLFLSRIHPKKGCDLLIDAFAGRAGADPDAHLVMAGPDQTGWGDALKSAAAKAGIADRITWTGMISGDIKWGAYRAAEAFILPTHHENFGIVVAEALACGLPVLISNQVQIWREIAAGEAGLIEPDSLEGAQRLIERWLATPAEDWRAMRGRAERCFEDRFEIGQYASRFAALVDTYAPETVVPCCQPA
ncbi:MAG: glycosyltransferase [Rhodocyclales bacterium]|nr:glycosyltransferase [Rhodocyclales bacterium]